MSLEQLHARCQHLQQTLIDLIAAVLELQDSQEWEHLQGILETARQVVAEDIPPLPPAPERQGG
jgi:hypothetical protein